MSFLLVTTLQGERWFSDWKLKKKAFVSSHVEQRSGKWIWRDVGTVTGCTDAQDGLQTRQREIMIMLVRKNARKHITSISRYHSSGDKMAYPRGTRERSTVYQNIYIYTSFHWRMQKKKEKTTARQCIFCVQRFESKPLTFGWTWGPPSPPCAVKAESTECAETSFWFPHFLKCTLRL